MFQLEIFSHKENMNDNTVDDRFDNEIDNIIVNRDTIDNNIIDNIINDVFDKTIDNEVSDIVNTYEEIIIKPSSMYMPCNNLNIFFQDIIICDRIRDNGISAIFIVTKNEERYMLEIHKVLSYNYDIYNMIVKFNGQEGFIDVERFCISEYEVYKSSDELIKSHYIYYHPNIKVNLNSYINSNICAFTLFKYVDGYTLDKVLPDLNTKEICLLLDKLLRIINHINKQGFIHNNINRYNVICTIHYKELMSFLNNISVNKIKKYNKLINILNSGVVNDELVNTLNVLNNNQITNIYKNSNPIIKVTLLEYFNYEIIPNFTEIKDYRLSNINCDLITILDILTHKIYDIKILLDKSLYDYDTMYLKPVINLNKIITSKYYRIIKNANTKLTNIDNLSLFRVSHTRDYMNIISKGFITEYKMEYRLPITVINNLYQNSYSIDNCIELINIFARSIQNGIVKFKKTIIIEKPNLARTIGIRKDLKLLV
jgi:hypothetical protein